MYGKLAVEFMKQRPISSEQSTPRMGGILVAIVPLLLSIPYLFYTTEYVFYWMYIVFLIGTVLGVIDDLSDISYIFKKSVTIKAKVLVSFLTGVLFGILLYESSLTELTIFTSSIDLGFWIILLSGIWFVIWFVTTIIDGIDSLSASVLIPVYLFLGTIFVLENKLILVILSVMIVGSLVAFLQKNIQPAKWYLTEVGITPLLFTIAALSLYSGVTGGLAFSFIPFVGIMLLITPLSNIIQLAYRSVKKKKLFRSAPIHHHFEAIGMKSLHVVMLYQLVSIIMAVLSLLFVLLIIT